MSKLRGKRYDDDDNDELLREPLRRAVKARERKLGADHLEVSESLTDLADVLRAQGKQDEAEPLYARALDIQERRLGATHPGTIEAVRNLANLFVDRGAARGCFFRRAFNTASLPRSDLRRETRVHALRAPRAHGRSSPDR